MGATFMHLMIKPHTPSPRANEDIFTSVEELSNMVDIDIE
jgi:hypothetical protein